VNFRRQLFELPAKPGARFRPRFGEGHALSAVLVAGQFPKFLQFRDSALWIKSRVHLPLGIDIAPGRTMRKPKGGPGAIFIARKFCLDRAGHKDILEFPLFFKPPTPNLTKGDYYGFRRCRMDQ
jgi:hypothetical protein